VRRERDKKGVPSAKEAVVVVARHAMHAPRPSAPNSPRGGSPLEVTTKAQQLVGVGAGAGDVRVRHAAVKLQDVAELRGGRV